jgi:nitrite reductase/ring-hydroxylating ferredoxin subunit
MKLIAHVDEIPVWGLKFSYTSGKLAQEGILVRLASGEIRAYKNECKHLPMRLDEREPHTYWDACGELLHCSSHGARFRVEDGLCISGPCAGDHLTRLPLKLIDGQVVLALDVGMG